MIAKYLATALVTTALMTGLASAQTTVASKPDPKAATMPLDGEWRASKLVGVNVYNEANEKIGDINEVFLDKSGKLANVILGVGGFLGIGEHYVAVDFDKLKWVDEPVSATTTGADRTTGLANAPSRSTDWYPDHAVYDATKDQLKAMPQFKF